MKKVYSAIAALVLAGAVSSYSTDAQAQLVVQIGNGTTTTGTFDTGPTPFGTYYHDDRTQILFTASELLAAGAVPGQILSVGWDVVFAGVPAMTNLNIGMAHSTNTAMAGFQTTGFTTVYSNASYLATTGWNDFTFPNPWTWNGTDNVIVEICFDNNAWDDNSTVNYTSTGSTNMVYSYYCDSWCNSNGGCENANTSSFYAYDERPNTRFGFLPPVANDAGIGNVISPALPTCDLDSVDVTVEVQTFGTNNLMSCVIKWQINGGTVSSMNYTGNIPAQGGVDTVTVTTQNFTNFDDLVIWTESPNGVSMDSLPNNDTTDITIATGLAGTYAIPGDYADFAAATADLAAFGVCDTVVFNVAAGSYDEFVELDQYLGVGPHATITFQGATGNPSNVVLHHAPTNTDGVVNMGGGDWITIKDMTIDNTNNGFSNGRVVVFGNGASHNTIENCILSGSQANTTSFNNAVIYGNSAGNDHNSFYDNQINSGSYGIYFYGTSASHNSNIDVIGNVCDSNYYAGIWLYYNDSVNVRENSVLNPKPYIFHYGIRLLDCDKDVNVDYNSVTDEVGSNTYYGIYLTNCDGNLNNRLNVSNNCVAIGYPGNNTFNYGLYFINTGLTNVVNNTITLRNTAGTGYAHYISGGGSIHEQNNSFVTYGSGYARYVTSVYSLIGSQTNNFYTTGNNVLYLSSAYTSVDAFSTETGFDLNSVSTNPVYTDTMTCATCNDTLDGGGLPFAGIVDDIDGQIRSVFTPDIGAVEYISASSFTLGGNDTICGDMHIVEAGPAQSVSWNVDGNVASTPTYTLTAGNQPQTFNVAVNILTNGCGPASDNAVITLVPAAALDSSDHLCAGDMLTLDPGGSSNATYAWSTGEMTQTIDVSEAGTYSVTKDEYGCESSSMIVITQSEAVEIADLEPCEDDAPISIDGTINDGISYAWSGGSSANTAVNTFDQSDIYTVTATDAFGCVSSDTFELNFIGSPVAAITYTSTGGFGVFFESTSSQQLSSNTTYNWTFNGTSTSTQANPYFLFPFSAGPVTYPVTLEINNGCDIDDETINITIDPLGTEELANGEKISVYPNPANNILNISKENAWKDAEFRLIDISGRVVLARTVSDATEIVTLDLSNVASGAYSLNILHDGSVKSLPVIVD